MSLQYLAKQSDICPMENGSTEVNIRKVKVRFSTCTFLFLFLSLSFHPFLFN